MILETSFLIDMMRGRREAVALVQEIDRSGENIALPSPGLFELWVGAGRSRRSREEMERIDSLIAAFDVLTLTDVDAKEAGLLQARLSLAGATMGTVDVLLAGMAKAREETLVTGDRDFTAVRRDVRIRSYARTRA
jgi:tRNA(fMet)-specific endonuclease VapC